MPGRGGLLRGRPRGQPPRIRRTNWPLDQYPPIDGDSIAPGDAAATGVASPSGVDWGAGVPTGAPNGASASCPYFIAASGRPDVTFAVAGAGLSTIVSATPSRWNGRRTSSGAGSIT